MPNNIKLEDKLEGVDNSQAWKYKVLFILEESDLENYVKEMTVELEGEEKQDRRRTWLGLRGSLLIPS